MNRILYDETQNSDANRGLFEIVKSLVQPSVYIQDWLERHGEQCSCTFCETVAIEYVVAALRALDWTINAASSEVTSIVPGSPKKPE